MKLFFHICLSYFALATFSQATDLQLQKIEKLEQLLQTYIKENEVLRYENQSLKAQVDGIEASISNQTTNALLNCDTDPKGCNDQDLCEKATYGLLGERNWKVGKYVIFVDEAKRRDLSCGVAVIDIVIESDTTIAAETKPADVLTTAKQRCEVDIAGCSEADLCQVATYGLLGNKQWKIENYTNFIEEAARRNVDCGVSKSANDALDESKAKSELAEKEIEPVAEIIRPNARKICDESFKECRTAELCQIATYNQAGATKWKIDGYQKYVDELRRRAENCGVLDEEQILSYKSDEELCSHATHESSQGKRWNVGSLEIFVNQVKRFVTTEDVLEEVKRRKISCNVQNEDSVDLDVAQIQTRLHHFGYEPGLVDGAWGKKTEAAFQQFLNDNSQADLSPNSLSAETFLYDFYEENFEQPVVSSVPCTSITSDYERTNRGDCVVIAHFNETSSNLVNPDKGDETTAIWDKFSAFPLIRILTDSYPEVIMWAWDVPKKIWIAHDLPGLAHMANYRIDFEAIYKNKKRLTLVNQSRKMPFSVRRYELSDLNNSGLEKLFLVGSREDGRSGGKKYKNLSNMLDFNYIYDFENDVITTVGKKTFSHDYGINDFDADGYKDILDLPLDKINGKFGYQYCDGRSLQCIWYSTDQFINGHSFLAHEKLTNNTFLNAQCGKRHARDEKAFWLCFFKLNRIDKKLVFNLVNKFELQPRFDAKFRWQAWHGDIKPSAFLGWKVDGYPVEEQVRKSANASAAAFKDLDSDGDVDMVAYYAETHCVKKMKSRNFYNSEDCDQVINYDYVFLQENGKFEISQIIEGSMGQINSYNFNDLNNDGHIDVLPTAVYHGKCVDTYENVLINNGDGTFKRTNEKFSGRYGCELASNFFEHDGQRYRAFTFKPVVKEQTFFDFDVYLAIEKLN